MKYNELHNEKCWIINRDRISETIHISSLIISIIFEQQYQTSANNHARKCSYEICLCKLARNQIPPPRLEQQLERIMHFAKIRSNYHFRRKSRGIIIEILGKDRSISSHPEVVIYKILQLNTLYIFYTLITQRRGKKES